MKLIEWDARLGVGIEDIDDQHKELLAIANRALVSVAEHKPDDVAMSVVQELRDYTVVHFRAEEAFMERHGFPDRAKHMLEHERLVRQVKEFQRRFYYHQSVTPDEVRIFVKSWLFDHILAWDMRYAKFCCKK